MITLQCCACRHVWQQGGDVGAVSGMLCPKCGSASVMRIGKRRGKWQNRTFPCEEFNRVRTMAEQVWQRTVPRSQTHKGKGPRS